MQCALFPLTALAHLFLIIIMFCLLFCCFHHCYLPLHFALFVCYYYMPVDSVVSAAIPLLLSSCCSAKVFHSHSSAAILCLLFALFSFLLLIVTCNIYTGICSTYSDIWGISVLFSLPHQQQPLRHQWGQSFRPGSPSGFQVFSDFQAFSFCRRTGT